MSLGATYLGNNTCHFRVWAPLVREVQVYFVKPEKKVLRLKQEERGYHGGTGTGIVPGSHYYYLLDGEKKRPDPASRYQPQGVHGPSQVVDLCNFAWSDRCWFGPSRQDLVIYELHVGAFTPQGNFEAIIPYLERLQQLGINAIELMPVAQFSGSRNWGYDSVYPYAVQNSYGGPEGLRRLVNACHERRMAVILDVVYNHLGPEGNYLADFAPYFTDRYHGPWGKALNFDGPESDEVRRFFLENAIYWLTEFHIDGFRLDAVHAIMDFSALPFLKELATAVHQEAQRLHRRAYVIAESDLNDARLVQPWTSGGYGLDAQWADDFHHALHALLTEEKDGYYQDFGTLRQLARAFQQGYVYTGQYSTYRRRRHGNIPRLNSAEQFVVYAQNHDQVGNRAQGERLASLVSLEGLKLAAATVLLSPFLPLLFMGEEYGEKAPFLYFTSFSDPRLAEAVREGRHQEFSAFKWNKNVPDPQDLETFCRSRLQHRLYCQGYHQVIFSLYRELLRLRRKLPALAELNMENMEVNVCEQKKVLFVQRWKDLDQTGTAFCFSKSKETAALPLPPGRWKKLLDTAEQQWWGRGSDLPPVVTSQKEGVRVTLNPEACVLWERSKEDSN